VRRKGGQLSRMPATTLSPGRRRKRELPFAALSLCHPFAALSACSERLTVILSATKDP
jgi:hypothetical protein